MLSGTCVSALPRRSVAVDLMDLNPSYPLEQVLKLHSQQRRDLGEGEVEAKPPGRC